jgi:hypothetical protein
VTVVYHLKCVVCRIRVRGCQSPAGEVGELCPLCGSALEPVRHLSELLGLQERKWEDDDELAADPDTSRWLADGGNVSLEGVVAEALAPPPPPRSRDA